MKPSQPPKLATLLLRHLLDSTKAEAIEGDLAEQYSHGRRMWYWRQVLWAIGLNLVLDVRDRPFRALRAVLFGNVLLYCLSVLFAIPMIIAGFPFLIHGEMYSISTVPGAIPLLRFCLLISCFAASALTGRLMASRWSSRKPGILLLFAVSTLVTVAGVRIFEDGSHAIAFGLGQASLIYDLARFSGILWGGLRIRREQRAPAPSGV
jgi:hypothetical protein